MVRHASITEYKSRKKQGEGGLSVVPVAEQLGPQADPVAVRRMQLQPLLAG